MPFETDFAHALDRTTDALDPDLTSLLDGAVERGRSRRRRRRAGVVAGVGACAAIAAAGLMLPGALAGTDHAGGSLMETVALAMPRSAISDTQMIEAVRKTFPGARFSQEHGQSNNPSDPSAGYVANGEVIVDDGHGAAMVGVSAMRLKLPLGDGGGVNCEPPAARAEGDTCTRSELPSSAAIPGGAVVLSERKAAEQPIGAAAGADTAHRWTVTVTLKSTGAQLQMVQWNSTGGGTGADTPKPTRATPPLSEQQAVAALTGATWAPILGAVG